MTPYPPTLSGWLAAAAFLVGLAGSPILTATPASGEEAGIRHPSELPHAERRGKPRRKPPRPSHSPALIPGEVRSIDGTGNNQSRPDWGAAGEALLRFVDPAYADGADAPAGADSPSTRAVSNAVCAQDESIPNRRRASDWLWQWGQFLDHDIDLTPGVDPPQYFPIDVPGGDPWFPAGVIPLNRSVYTEIDGVRQQLNLITAYIDASNVYGSDPVRAAALRTNDGTGRLKTTASPHGDLLPYNVDGLPNAQEGPAPAASFFLAGDERANEQAGLTAVHTLFVREHNHWAGKFAELNPDADGEECYQFARMIVAAEMQAVTYREFLPVLIGHDALPPYRGYDPGVDAGITNIFSTGAYRLGHSMLSATLLRLDADGNEIDGGHLPLAMAFFRPSHLEDHGIDPLLRGLAKQRCQEIDNMVVDAVRNMLFGEHGPGFDLAALNMQRGRDHGLPTYTEVCAGLGLTPAADFHEINPDPAVWQRLAAVYDHVDDVDCWVGGLCEPHVRGSMTGPMIRTVLIDQFTRLRDGDRFYYKHYLPPLLVRLVEHQTLARIIRRNTGIGNELAGNVFLVRPGKPRFPGKHSHLAKTVGKSTNGRR